MIGRVAIMVACVLGAPLAALILLFGSGLAHNFYIPSEAMAPTLEKYDRLVSFMDGAASVRRGRIIVFAMDEATYVKRVAGLPGDRIALKDGIVILNGQPVGQRFLREEARNDSSGPGRARRLQEQFPDEPGPHEILDSGPLSVDEMAEIRIPPGFLFVLGDNRDHSADSRVPRDMAGVELLPVADVRGHPLFFTWPRTKVGRLVD